MLAEGTKAPRFAAIDQYKGSWVMLYFYPKDNTPGCTKEACAIRDAWTDFVDAGIIVLGVSADSEKSHGKFAEKFSLPFPLLSDPDKKIITAYQAWGEKKMYGRTYEGILRITYLISPDGLIAKTYEKVKPDIHAAQILEDIKTV